MPPLNQGYIDFYKLWSALKTAQTMMADRGYTVTPAAAPATLADFMRAYVSKRPETGAGGGAAMEGGGFTANEEDDVLSLDAHQLVAHRDRMTLVCERRVGADGGGGGAGDISDVLGVNHAADGGSGASAAATAAAATAGGVGGTVQRACVFFFPGGNLGTMLKDCVEGCQAEGISLAVVVAGGGKVSSIAHNMVAAINRSGGGVRVQLFEEDDLVVNVTQHVLVPRHRPLTAAQEREVLQANALKKEQLPRLLSTDPVARYYGLVRGDVVRIERSSVSAGVYVTYRQVV